MKKQQTNSIIQAIETFSSFLKKLSQAEIEKIENGSSYIQFSVVDKKNNLMTKVKNEINPDEIIKILNLSKTRESALEFLNSQIISRQVFEEILKKLDYPFSKKDKIEKLKEKIIESVIGYKLRSEAIQGNLNEK